MTALELIREGSGIWVNDSGAALTWLIIAGFMILGYSLAALFGRKSHDVVSDYDQDISTNNDSLDTATPPDDATRRLTETLSTTFSNLTTGIAVFDRDRTLKIFNPALIKLLALDPAWLIQKPSLADILGKLRENQHLPAHKDFREWAQLLAKMETITQGGPYNEKWTLPDGTTLLVTGHPHSQGAVTFLFADVSSQIAAERQRKSEIALNQEIMNVVSDAVAIIDQTGNIRFVNSAFGQKILSEAPENGTTHNLDFVTACNHFPMPTSFITKLRAYISKPDGRAPWGLSLGSPTNTQVSIFPLPDGATLILFSASQKPSPHLSLEEIQQITNAMITHTTESTSMNDPLNLNGLTEFLNQRNISLNLENFSNHDVFGFDPAKARRILWYLVLATSNNCDNSGEISLSTSIDRKRVQITCSTPNSMPNTSRGSHLSLNLLRQLVDQAGGGADWVFDDTAHPLSISCVLPIIEPATISQLMVGRI